MNSQCFVGLHQMGGKIRTGIRKRVLRGRREVKYMEDKKKLLELIERERKQLDEAVKMGLDGEKVYEQSVRLDRMIDEYYKMLES